MIRPTARPGRPARGGIRGVCTRPDARDRSAGRYHVGSDRRTKVLDPGFRRGPHGVPRRRKCLQTTFESLGLGAELVRSLSGQGYTEPTALQGETIPAILAGRDVLALAGDGAGRTLAYGLPVLARLRGEPASAGTARTSALVLVA